MKNIENIDLFEAEVLLTVMEEESISFALKKVPLSQSAVSKLIMRVEHNYNILIFDKNKKPWQLTPAGLIFKEFIVNILKEHDIVRKKLDDITENRTGSLTFYTMPYEDKYVLPNVLANFYKKYPEFKINVVLATTKAIESKLLEKKADFAIVIPPLNNKGIIAIPIMDCEVLMGIPNDYLLEKNIKIPDNKKSLPSINLSIFADKSFILHKSEYKFRDIQEEVFQKSGVSPNKNSTIEIEQHITGMGLASNGLGICFLSDDAASRVENTDNVSFFRIKGIRPKQTVAVGYLKTRKLNDIEKDFIKIIKESTANAYYKKILSK